MLERDLQGIFLRELDRRKIYYVKIISATTSGHADCVACCRGVFTALEFKTSTGRLAPLQMYKSIRVTESGGKYYVVRPENYKEILKKIAGKP